MIGSMRSRHALLPIIFHVYSKPDFSIEFVIDTGFSGELTLPIAAVAALELPYDYTNVIRLADDSPLEVPIHRAVIQWNGSERKVRVLATGRRPLLGTALLDDYELRAQFRESGLVTVEEL